MWTIAGLGNPGKEYEHTRHNIAWLILREVIQEKNLPSLHESGAFSSNVSEGTLYGNDVRIILPTTFMNNSGVAVKKSLADGIDSLIVVHDEVDLPFGAIRIGVGRGAGGHNGVKSIINTLGTPEFIRIRVGVGKKNIFGILRRPNGDALSDFVLGELTKKEVGGLSDIAKRVDQAIEMILTKDVEAAMNSINAE